MALQEADAPDTGRDLKGIMAEIEEGGKPDTWYFVTSYEIAASARTTAYTLRSQYPAMDIRADQGSVLARKKAT